MSGNAALRELFLAELSEHSKVIGAWLAAGPPAQGEPAPENVRRALHSIKGAARVMEVSSLPELVQAAERCLEPWEKLSPSQMQTTFGELAELVGYLGRVAGASDPMRLLADSAIEQKAMRVAFERIAVPTKPSDTDTGSTSPSSAKNAPMESSLLEIFRAEVEQHAKVLGDGLVVLDNEAPSPQLWEKLMRAAHSLKGAARIVKLQSVAQLAHSLEDCFVLAQNGSVTLSNSDIDVLLQAVDAMAHTASWMLEDAIEGRAKAEAAAEINLERLTALLGGGGPPEHTVAGLDVGYLRTQIGASTLAAQAKAAQSPGSARPREKTVISVPPAWAAREASRDASPAQATAGDSLPLRAAPAPAVPVLAADSAPAVARHAAPTMVGTPRAMKMDLDRVLRVDAESMNVLVGLAGESLVESRRVSSFAQSLSRVKKHETRLIDLIDDMESLLRAQVESEGGLTQLAHDVKREARECARLLGEHSASLEGYVRRAEQLGERLYREALKSRMRPFSDGAHGFPRAVRDLARDLGKRAKLELAGQNTEVDRDALESLDAPINHLIRNALDHGVETPDERLAAGKKEVAIVRIEARHHAGMLRVAVSDDGRGIDVERIRGKVVERGIAPESMAKTLTRAELLDFLFLPGFSTANSVSEISGRGVGLDVVKSSVEVLGGSVRITTELGKGTTFHLQLPVTRSVIRAVVAQICGEAYAFPLLRINRIDRIPVSRVHTLENRQYILLDDTPVSLISARHLFGLTARESEPEEINVVVVSDRKQHFGIVVDELRGEHDLVVRPLDARLGKIPDIAAAAVLMDGEVALIIDVDDMTRSVDRLIQGGRTGSATSLAFDKRAAKKRVLVVDDSITVREAQRQLLVNRGYDVDVAVDGVEGWSFVRNTRYDLVITDIDMPRMNGIELVKHVKQDPALGRVPVIIVSYKDREEDRLLGLDAGANYYLTKSSFHDDKLVEAVEDLIGGQEA